MQRRRRVISALLSLSAALLGVAALPGSASAAVNISVISAGPAAGNPAVISVEADDANGLQISSMTVHLFSGTTDVWDSPLGDMAYASGPDSDQVWTATTPIAEGSGTGQLRPGTYTMTVDASDSSPETDNGLVPTGPDTLPFVWTGTALTASATALSFSNPTTATISGTLTGVVNTSLAPAGIGGEPVLLVDQTTSSTPAQIATTASDGSFSGTAALNPADHYIVQVAADAANSVPATGSPTFTTSVTPDATRLISVTVAPAHLTYGKTGRLTGTAQYDNAGTWTALPSATVQVSVGTHHLPPVQTDSTGGFSSAMPTKDGVAWQATIGPVTPYLQSAQASGTLTVAVPLTVRSFAASLSSGDSISASSCMQATVQGYGAPKTAVELQYSTGPRGPWKDLGKIRTGHSSSCDSSNESYFTGSLSARLANAYYRADYVGDDHFQHVVSETVHAWKYLTSIRSFTVTPHSVGTGGTITVSGQLWQQRGSWHTYGRQTVELRYRVGKTKTWSLLGSVRTSASGKFTGRATVGPGRYDAILDALYLGDKTHLRSQSSSVTIKVNGGESAGMRPAARLRWLAQSGM